MVVVTTIFCLLLFVVSMFDRISSFTRTTISMLDAILSSFLFFFSLHSILCLCLTACMPLKMLWRWVSVIWFVGENFMVKMEWMMGSKTHSHNSHGYTRRWSMKMIMMKGQKVIVNVNAYGNHWPYRSNTQRIPLILFCFLFLQTFCVVLRRGREQANAQVSVFYYFSNAWWFSSLYLCFDVVSLIVFVPILKLRRLVWIVVYSVVLLNFYTKAWVTLLFLGNFLAADKATIVKNDSQNKMKTIGQECVVTWIVLYCISVDNN